jgi:hypothetical protein
LWTTSAKFEDEMSSEDKNPPGNLDNIFKPQTKEQPPVQDKRYWRFGYSWIQELEQKVREYEPQLLQDLETIRAQQTTLRKGTFKDPLTKNERIDYMFPLEDPKYKPELDFEEIDERKQHLSTLLSTQTFFKSMCIKDRFAPLKLCQHETFVVQKLSSGCENEANIFLMESKDEETDCSKALYVHFILFIKFKSIIILLLKKFNQFNQ